MAKALMLWPAEAAIRIGSAEAARLAALGVTSLTLLRNAELVAVVLDGWAFNPSRSARAAGEALGDVTACRVLEPAIDIAVLDARPTGGFDAPTTSTAPGDAGSREPDGH